MTAAEWIAKRRQLEQESRPSGYGLVPTNAVNRYHADALRSLPLALNALEAALGMANAGAITSRARGDSEEERRWLDFLITVESALRTDS